MSDASVLGTKTGGDAFGELALLLDEKRSADILALDECHFAILRRADYLDIVNAKHREEVARKLRMLDVNPLFNVLLK